ncbi:MAG: polyprenol monophosphomannose synthase [Ilumatobacteraceae bacterium]
MRIAIMSPTYNERDNVDEFLHRVGAVIPTADIYIVDDDSPDGTGSRVREIGTSNPRVRLIARTGERGYAAASRDGLVQLAHSGYDAIITIDCDLSHDPAVIPLMLDQLESGADVVIGSRYADGGGIRNWSLFRRLLSRCGNWYTGFMLGVGVRDCTSGFRAYRSEVIRSGTIADTTSNGYAFLTEVLLRLRQRGVGNFVEVPIVYVERVAGESKMSKTIISESMRKVTGWGLERWFRRR